MARSNEDLEKKLIDSLSKQFPTKAAASTEMINLQSILNLPKGTEHFLTDIHGEYEQFNHVLKNGSGSVRRKIDEEFGNTLTIKDKKSLATLSYYPEEKLALIEKEEENIDDWYRITLHRLVALTRRVASKYTRSKVRKALPKDFAYVIEELITEKAEVQDKEGYYNSIISTIIWLRRAPEFITAISNLIQRLVIDHLHIVGDIYDRGPGAHIIMDTLLSYHSVDIEWGNHDIIWMAAASGHAASIATVIRLSVRYANLATLEEGYGINLIPLVTFAMETYKDSDCAPFAIRPGEEYNRHDMNMDEMVHKAVFVIQMKLEGQLIKRHPEFEMDDRLVLSMIDYDNGTIELYGKTYPLKCCDFPTIDPTDPYKLTPEEEEVVERLKTAFMHSEKLQKHVRFLYSKGSMYRVYNGNLLYHGCVPMDENGSFMSMKIDGKEYAGKALYDMLETYARKAYSSTKDQAEKQKGQDYMYYIWTGAKSPVFGKDRMATFESYMIEDKETHKENKNPYYNLRDNEEVVDSILKEFGLEDVEDAHIVNGHVPVELKKGESPVLCGGKLFIIDGGFSKAYQSKTGIAGYTLVYNSHGLRLVAHEPFTSAEDAIRNETDIVSDSEIIESKNERILVEDTDTGRELREQIAELAVLLSAYEDGTIPERG
ncbi:MAG: fructose-1,6-bisphosphatase [Lachnospiraceae bacterium]|nr:fructose-1,6-bisphosphatase [Lachnospiraceae bacterium]